MTTNWQSILDKKPEEATRPPPTPTGNYLAIVTKFSFEESKEKKTPYVQYIVKLVSPVADVDPTALAAAGGMEKIAAREFKLDYYMTDDAAWRHREFLEKTLKINFAGRGWMPCINEAANKQLTVHISHTPNKKNPTEPPYANIDDTGPV